MSQCPGRRQESLECSCIPGCRGRLGSLSDLPRKRLPGRGEMQLHPFNVTVQHFPVQQFMYYSVCLLEFLYNDFCTAMFCTTFPRIILSVRYFPVPHFPVQYVPAQFLPVQHCPVQSLFLYNIVCITCSCTTIFMYNIFCTTIACIICSCTILSVQHFPIQHFCTTFPAQRVLVQHFPV